MWRSGCELSKSGTRMFARQRQGVVRQRQGVVRQRQGVVGGWAAHTAAAVGGSARACRARGVNAGERVSNGLSRPRGRHTDRAADHEVARVRVVGNECGGREAHLGGHREDSTGNARAVGGVDGHGAPVDGVERATSVHGQRKRPTVEIRPSVHVRRVRDARPRVSHDGARVVVAASVR